MLERVRLSFFLLRRSFFERALARTNEADRSNILAPGFWPAKLPDHLFPAFTVFCGGPECFRGTTAVSQANRLPIQRNRIQLQQRNCSGIAPDFSRRSTDQTRKELPEQYRLALKRSRFI